MSKTIYTERDIEDFVRNGQKELQVNENVVLTDLASEKAEKLGLNIVEVSQFSTSTQAKSFSSQVNVINESRSTLASHPYDRVALTDRIKAVIRNKYGDQLDQELINLIINRVLDKLN